MLAPFRGLGVGRAVVRSFAVGRPPHPRPICARPLSGLAVTQSMARAASTGLVCPFGLVSPNSFQRQFSKNRGVEMEKSRKRSQALSHRRREPQPVRLPPFVSPLTLSNLLGVRTVDILKMMIKLGMSPMSSKDPISDDVVDLLCSELSFIPVREEIETEQPPQWVRYENKEMTKEELDRLRLIPRPPIVTVVGHVNHGKTTLLDALKGVETAAGEAGGITQFLSAFMVVKDGRALTFLDTPGHAAFSTMRGCSAGASDLVILVVAGDEGVKEQTVEAIRTVKESKKRFVIAITKSDKEGRNYDKLAQQLVRHNVYTDRIGGDVITVPVSAVKKDGLDDLCDAIFMEADHLGMKACPTAPAEAVVLDTKLNKAGLAVFVMTKWGTLRKGEHIVVGEHYGRVRTLEVVESGRVRQVNEVGPSTPVFVYGLKDAPMPGDLLVSTAGEKEARDLVRTKKNIRTQTDMMQALRESIAVREKTAEDTSAADTEDDEGGEAADAKLLCVIIKAQMWGSATALRDSLTELAAVHQEEVSVRVVKSGLGSPSDVDIDMAKDSNGLLLCFGVGVPDAKRQRCTEMNVKLITSDVIYSILDEFRAHLGGLLLPHLDLVIDGEAKVAQVFTITKSGHQSHVAGCQVVSGSIVHGASARVLRNGEVVFDGRVCTLRHFKENINVAKSGTECGVSLGEKGSDDDVSSPFLVTKGDVIQMYRWQSTPRKVGEKRRMGRAEV